MSTIAGHKIFKTIPSFPTFITLHIDHKKDLQDYLKQYPAYSDYNFVSLWANNIENDIIVSNLHNNFVMRFRDYIDNTPFYTFIGVNKLEKTISELLKYAEKESSNPHLKLIPEISMNEKKLHELFEIIEDVDNHDYIFKTEDWVKLPDRKYYDKRNLVRRFQKDHPHVRFEILDLSNLDTQADIIRVFQDWGKLKAKAASDIEHELEAVRRVFLHELHHELIGFGLYKEKELIAFLLVELLSDSYCIFQFMKADTRHKGIIEYLNHRSAKYLLEEKNIQYINYEQDLGIDGLRKAKQYWNPHTYLKKYIIKPKHL